MTPAGPLDSKVEDSMSATRLLRNPLLSTPQGWVVLGSVAAYLLLAVAFAAFEITPPLGKSVGTSVSFCVFWPFVVFLLFIKHDMRSLTSSWSSTAFLAVCALAPVVLVWWAS